MATTEQTVQELLDRADVKINGSRPFDIRVHNPHFFERALSEGMLGLGESYMDGWWNCDALDECFYRILQADLEKEAGRQHYDVGNDLYRRMLDSRMNYTCGWGSFAKYAAERYGARVIGLTISQKQVELGNQLAEGLPVEIKLQD